MPSTEEIQAGLSSFFSDIMQKYENQFDMVVIEEQPFICDKEAPMEARLTNFRLQQIDMGLRGLVMGMGKELITVQPRSVKCHLKTSTGVYDKNKRAHVDWCYNRLGIVFKNLEPLKRHHVADTVCNVIYVLSKKLGKYRLNEFGQQQSNNGPFRERRQKLPSFPRDTSSSLIDEGCGDGDSQEFDSPD